MKLALLHGLGVISSRQKLGSIKSKFSDGVVVFEKSADPQTVLSILNTPSLFGGEQLIVLENPSEDFSYDITTFQNLQLILWFDHEVSIKKPVLDWVKKSKGEILLFPEAKEISIFPFLDLLGNRDKRAFLELDRLKKTGIDNQYILTMIYWLLRNLSCTPKTAKDFVKVKNEKMRANFKDLKSIYESMFEIDTKIKTGLLENQQALFLMVNTFVRA